MFIPLNIVAYFSGKDPRYICRNLKRILIAYQRKEWKKLPFLDA